MKPERLTVYWIAFCLLVAAVYYLYVTDVAYDCEGRGWTMRTTENELDNKLVIGTLADGREVAFPRAAIQGCRVVAE